MPLWFDLMMSGATTASGGLLLATAANSKVSKTTDGITWTAANPSFGVYDVNSAGMDSTYAVVVANNGNLATAPYPSISAWTNRTSSFSTSAIFTVLKYGSTWVAAGASAKLATASDPTSTWTQNTSSGITGTLTYLNQDSTKLYVTSNTDTLWETTNAASTWTNVTPSFGGAAAEFRTFAWNGSLYVMAIRISTGGTSGRHEIWTATSISGTWTQRYTESYSGSSGSYTTRAFYLGGSFFVPIPNGSFRISSDGITWAAGTPPVSPIPTAVRMSYIAGNYVWGTTGPNVYYSPNYTTWTSVNSQVGSNAISALVAG